MRDHQESEDELLSADRRWWRRWYVMNAVFAVVVLAIMIGWFTFALAYHPFRQLGLSPQAGQQLIIAVPMLVCLCIVFAMRYFAGPPPASRNETVVRRTADRHYARLRWFYPTMVAVIAIPLFTIPELRVDAFYSLIIAMAAQTLFILRGFGWSKSFRRGLDDELTRALRAKAVKFGHALAAAILIAACIYARYRPVSADMLLLRILFITSVTPVLYFLFLEWQSGRNG